AGKDVLTIFVGILGTIVGYYFGHNSESKADNPDASESLSLSKPVFGILNLNFGAGITNTTLTATITGGTGPYTYSIGFFGPSSHPTPITNIPPALSEDGKIACQVNLPAGIGTLTPVSFSITVQDAAGHFQAFSYGPSFGLTVK
ncbi:MAG: hypothetical protein JSS02_21675, partial [Planctomycetes bacterium]|nr:hypothetical protein [Planctomycetota bacterium]